MTSAERALLTFAGFEVRSAWHVHDPLTGHAIPLYRALQIATEKQREQQARAARAERQETNGDEI